MRRWRAKRSASATFGGFFVPVEGPDERFSANRDAPLQLPVAELEGVAAADITSFHALFLPAFTIFDVPTCNLNSVSYENLY